MRCTECQAKVEDYFDGELDERTTEWMAQHISVCDSCAAVYQRLENEQALYLRYECEASPAPDFWDNVLARAAQETAARPLRPLSLLRDRLSRAFGHFNAPRLSPSLAALLVIVAITVTVGVMRLTGSREEQSSSASIPQNEDIPAGAPSANGENITSQVIPPETNDEGGGKGDSGEASDAPQIAKTPKARKGAPSLVAGNRGSGARTGINSPAPVRERTTDALVREAEQKYVAAIAMLSRDVNRRRSRLDPETAARFERTLAAVDRTIADTRQAARRHPGDPVAAQYMLTAYAKKVDVLREMVGY
jgi:hypothetical protein